MTDHLNLPHTPLEYTQFALEYRDIEFFDKLFDCADDQKHTLSTTPSETRMQETLQLPVMQELIAWLKYTKQNFPEYITIDDQDPDFVILRVCQVFVIAYGDMSAFGKTIPDQLNL